MSNPRTIETANGSPDAEPAPIKGNARRIRKTLLALVFAGSATAAESVILHPTEALACTVGGIPLPPEECTFPPPPTSPTTRRNPGTTAPRPTTPRPTTPRTTAAPRPTAPRGTTATTSRTTAPRATTGTVTTPNTVDAAALAEQNRLAAEAATAEQNRLAAEQEQARLAAEATALEAGGDAPAGSFQHHSSCTYTNRSSAGR